MTTQVLLLDLDGTLIDSESGIRKQLITTLEHFDLPIEPSTIDQVLYTGQNVFDRYLKLRQLNKEPLSKQELWKAYYRDHLSIECQLFEGIQACLDFAKAHTQHIYLVSNTPPHLSAQKIELLGLTTYFKQILGPKPPAIRPKPYPDMLIPIQGNHPKLPKSAYLMVGDTTADIGFAHQNGIDIISCLYGIGQAEDLLSLNPKYHAQTPQDLLQLLGNIL